MHSPWLRKTVVVLVLIAAGLYFAFVQESERSAGLTWIDLAEQRAAENRPGELVPVEPPLGVEDGPAPLPALPKLPVRIHGSVTDARGQPVPRIALERRHAYLSAASTVTNDDGHFELEVEELHGELVPADPAWMLLGGARHLSEDQSEGYQIVVAPAAVFRGKVLDERGAPVKDAALFAFPPSDALVAFGIVARPVEHESQRGWSGADGEFRIGPVPYLPGARIEATLTGYEIASAALPDDPALPVVLVLRAR